jgi:hypothetical protein
VAIPEGSGKGELKPHHCPWTEPGSGAAGSPRALLLASPVARAHAARKHAPENLHNLSHRPRAPSPLTRGRNLYRGAPEAKML